MSHSSDAMPLSSVDAEVKVRPSPTTATVLPVIRAAGARCALSSSESVALAPSSSVTRTLTVMSPGVE